MPKKKSDTTFVFVNNPKVIPIIEKLGGYKHKHPDWGQGYLIQTDRVSEFRQTMKDEGLTINS